MKAIAFFIFTAGMVLGVYLKSALESQQVAAARRAIIRAEKLFLAGKVQEARSDIHFAITALTPTEAEGGKP